MLGLGQSLQPVYQEWGTLFQTTAELDLRPQRPTTHARAAVEERTFTYFCGRQEFLFLCSHWYRQTFLKHLIDHQTCPKHYLNTQTLHSVAKTEECGFSLPHDVDFKEIPQ